MALSLGAAEAMDLGSMSLSGYPFTLTGWFRVPDVSQGLFLLRIANSGTGTFHTLVFEGYLVDQVAAISSSGGFGIARTSAAMTPGNWHHVAGVFQSSVSRTVYLDGGNAGSNTQSCTFDAADQFQVGNHLGTTTVDVAEVAVFAAALSTDQIDMLAAGFPPSTLPASANLLAYHDCVRRINVPGWGAPASVASTPPVATHPRVWRVSGEQGRPMPVRTPGPYAVGQQAVLTSNAKQLCAVPGIPGEAAEVFAMGFDSIHTRVMGKVVA